MTRTGGKSRKLYSGPQTATEALIAALERRAENERLAAMSEAEREALAARWSHKNEGTPETHEKFNAVPQRRRDWPLARMVRLGTIDADELASAHEIASVAEMIERQVGIGAASLEARVDHSASARDALVESLGRVRMEVAYTSWRAAIMEPRRMILDMLLTNVSYVELARINGLHWRTAKKRLIHALRIWPSHKIAARAVDREEVEEVYRRIGEGILLQPKPKTEEPAGSIADDAAR